MSSERAGTHHKRMQLPELAQDMNDATAAKTRGQEIRLFLAHFGVFCHDAG